MDKTEINQILNIAITHVKRPWRQYLPYVNGFGDNVIYFDVPQSVFKWKPEHHLKEPLLWSLETSIDRVKFSLLILDFKFNTTIRWENTEPLKLKRAKTATL